MYAHYIYIQLIIIVILTDFSLIVSATTTATYAF